MDNTFTVLPELGPLTGLTSLSMDSVKLAGSLSLMTQLTRLVSLSCMRMPPEVANVIASMLATCTQLARLHVSVQGPWQVPCCFSGGSFYRLTNLEELTLYHMEGIALELPGSLVRVTSLGLHDVPLSNHFLPASLSGLQSLRLSQNGLRHLPDLSCFTCLTLLLVESQHAGFQLTEPLDLTVLPGLAYLSLHQGIRGAMHESDWSTESQTFIDLIKIQAKATGRVMQLRFPYMSHDNMLAC